ncbi:MAG: hypothetical protein ACI35R_05775 [Bacillus sp. (in: firmicutes)]
MAKQKKNHQQTYNEHDHTYSPNEKFEEIDQLDAHKHKDEKQASGTRIIGFTMVGLMVCIVLAAIILNLFL